MTRKQYRPRQVEKDLVTSIKAAYWLADTDLGAVKVMRSLAKQIDVLERSSASQGTLLGDDAAAAIAGKITYVSGQLHRMMTDMGLTTQGRQNLGFVMDKREENPLDSLRAEVVELAAVRSPDAEDRDAENTGR